MLSTLRACRSGAGLRRNSHERSGRGPAARRRARTLLPRRPGRSASRLTRHRSAFRCRNLSASIGVPAALSSPRRLLLLRACPMLPRRACGRAGFRLCRRGPGRRPRRRCLPEFRPRCCHAWAMRHRQQRWLARSISPMAQKSPSAKPAERQEEYAAYRLVRARSLFKHCVNAGIAAAPAAASAYAALIAAGS